MARCPDCDIDGRVYLIGSGPQPCRRCHGTTEITEQEADWIRRGKAMRDRRVNGTPYRKLHDEAKRRGLDAVTVSQMESGRIEPVEESADA